MSFLGLFLECDYSYYVVFVDATIREIDICYTANLKGKFRITKYIFGD
jgi:hypothetical protein